MKIVFSTFADAIPASIAMEAKGYMRYVRYIMSL